MSSRAFAAKAFFESLSDEVAGALAAHLELPSLCMVIDQRACLYARWQKLEAAQRRELESDLMAIAHMGSPHARSYLVRVAQKRWTSTRPDWLPFIVAWSTPDLAARMYLEDPHGFHEAHRHYRVDQREQHARYRGHFVADVVPSLDRRERLKAALRAQFSGLVADGREVFDHVADLSFSFFIHEQPLELDERGARAEDALSACPVWLSFDFDTCELVVKAASRSDRERVRDAFAACFVGVANYFAEHADAEHDVIADGSDEQAFAADAFDQARLERVAVERVIVRPKHADVKRITIEFAEGLALDRAHRALENHGIRLQSDAVEGAKLSFVFSAGNQSSRARSVELKSSPDALKRATARERSIHRYVRDWTLDADRRDPLVAAACSGNCE